MGGSNCAGLEGSVARSRNSEAGREERSFSRPESKASSSLPTSGQAILAGLSPEPAGIGAGFAAFVGELIELILEALLAILEIFELGVAVVNHDHALRETG